MQLLTLVSSWMLLCTACAFSPPAFTSHVAQTATATSTSYKHGSLFATDKENAPDDSSSDDADAEQDTETEAPPKISKFLEQKFPSLAAIISDDVRKSLASGPTTVFAPNEEAFTNLGSKKLGQLKDPRNLEIVEKLAGYHVVPDSCISAVELMTEDWTRGRPKDGSKPNTVIAGVVTASGKVPVGRQKEAEGPFGLFSSKESGEIVIGPSALIIQSYTVGECMVHEMNALVSPEILWRYCDQLQINILGGNKK